MRFAMFWRHLPRRVDIVRAGMAAMLTAACLSGVAQAQTLRVMSFNVRLPVDSDGENRWEARRDLMADVIRRQRPDIIGTQELYASQGNDLVARLPDYVWFGRGRRGDDGDEHMGVFYRKREFSIVESGDFWLSDTPEVAGSITWGNLYPRMATWALFERKRDGRRFYVFNTHFPYRDEDDMARTRCAKLLLERIRALPPDAPVALIGDFNTTDRSEAHALLSEALTDAWTVAPRRAGPEGTFHGFTGRPDRRIDWIMTRGFDARSVRVSDEARNGRYPSDHFPVIAVLRWRDSSRRRDD